MFYVNFDIKINNKGEFESVVSAGKTYSLDEWNKQVESTPLKYQKEKSSNSSAQSGGCSGSENGCWLFAQGYNDWLNSPASQPLPNPPQ